MGSISKIEAIDILSEAALHRVTEISRAIYNEFDRHPNLYARELNQNMMLGSNENNSLFRFFSRTDSETKMKILGYLGIGDFYDIIIQYISFCNDSSPIVLKDVSANALLAVERMKLDVSRDVRSWPLFWLLSTEEAKLEILDYIAYPNIIDRINEKKGEELGLLLNKSDMLHNQMKHILLKEGLTTTDLSLLSPGDKAEWNALYEQSKKVSEEICKLVNG